MKSAEADDDGDLFGQLAIWLTQDFPQEVTSAGSDDSGPDRQKSSYGLPAPSTDHIIDVGRKDPNSAKGLIDRLDAHCCITPPAGPQASNGECVCRPGTSQSASPEAQLTTPY
ncbi:hypothetical protein KGQ19_01510 [Catenulispora sp. NL8]|uniref:Uncharacterized protein n=1 Tax=Catenulispora pinistramenti TaxID=2705254 RepID=A0ABS5KGU7_9ACTN|nr:hypothetical protein [Catenulispora pinistramenti]MBS2545538.1 hypothetical protein [Catenulispora pinistramenti]